MLKVECRINRGFKRVYSAVKIQAPKKYLQINTVINIIYSDCFGNEHSNYKNKKEQMGLSHSMSD